MQKRCILLFVVLNLLFSLAAIRICSVILGVSTDAADTQSSITIEIGQSRGTIYDCNGEPLTDTTYIYKAAVPPSADAIAAVSGYLNDTQRRRLQDGYPVCVTVDERFHHENIRVFKVSQRYGDQPLASHLIGYTDGDGAGVCGIEKSYEDLLQGGSLSVRFQQDAHGNILSGIEPELIQEGQSPGSVTLTIDKNIQLAAQQAAEKYLPKGAVVVLENSTGKIRAMASTPTFDPGNVQADLDSAQAPFINRALAAYNTGSVFKLCTAACALENGLYPHHTCTGKIDIQGVLFHCLKQDGHGRMDMRTALAMSCNTYFIALGQQLPANTLYNLAKAFRFGQSTTLCNGLESAAGTLPNTDILQSPAAIANFSFGQGELMTTPLQIASMLQTICNDGGLICPSLIQQVTARDGTVQIEQPAAATRVLQPQTAKTLQSYMVYTVEHGTGASAKPQRVGAGGKTATAETGQTDNGREIVQAWFAGFFPDTDPKYTVVVLSEDGQTGGQSAAPVFKSVADSLY